MPADRQRLEEAIGYTFRDESLLVRALTHRSCPADPPEGQPRLSGNNEALEFLGDAVLGFLVSDYLIRSYPGLPEGKLHRRKVRLVSEPRLHEVALRIDLGRHLLLGRAVAETRLREHRSLLADAMEAVIAAVYLDGGHDAARELVSRLILAGEAALRDEIVQDHKTALQERAHARKLADPRYTVVEEQGPAHQRVFVVEARAGDLFLSRASGTTKKRAEQEAARLLLEQMRDE